MTDPQIATALFAAPFLALCASYAFGLFCIGRMK